MTSGVSDLQTDPKKRLILALDTSDHDSALELVTRTAGVVGTFKVGLELFTAVGPRIVETLRKRGADVFLDLKLHDIPNTVASAVRAAEKIGVSLLTLHASGGPSMLRAAQEALTGKSTKLLAVTVLTSLSAVELAETGIAGKPQDAVFRFVRHARAAGIYGCVCSPEEAALIRKDSGASFGIVCPGIRSGPAVPGDDQTRTATAFDAIRDGADYVVVGRPIRTAIDPAASAAMFLSEIERGLAARSSA